MRCQLDQRAIGQEPTVMKSYADEDEKWEGH